MYPACILITFADTCIPNVSCMYLACILHLSYIPLWIHSYDSQSDRYKITNVSWCISMYLDVSWYIWTGHIKIHARYMCDACKVHGIRILITNPTKFDNKPHVTPGRASEAALLLMWCATCVCIIGSRVQICSCCCSWDSCRAAPSLVKAVRPASYRPVPCPVPSCSYYRVNRSNNHVYKQLWMPPHKGVVRQVVCFV